jgi:hypothetical protein
MNVELPHGKKGLIKLQAPENNMAVEVLMRVGGYKIITRGIIFSI